MISFGILLELSNVQHQQALSSSDAKGDGRKAGRDNDTVGRLWNRIGIVGHGIQEPSPIKKDLGQGTHGIGIKDIDKGHLSGQMTGRGVS